MNSIVSFATATTSFARSELVSRRWRSAHDSCRSIRLCSKSSAIRRDMRVGNLGHGKNNLKNCRVVNSSDSSGRR